MGSILLGAAATATEAATAGLFGSGGAFAIGQTVSTLGLGASVLGTVASTNSQNKGLEYNAKIQEQNALLADDAAKRNVALEKRENERELELLRKQQKRERGQRVADIAASGLSLSGSPLSVLTSQDWLDKEEQNSLIVSSNQRQRNMLYQSRTAQNASLNSANSSRMQTSNAGYWGAAGTLLSKGSKAYG